jgi:hypothetical protein
VATALQANIHYGSGNKHFQAREFITWCGDGVTRDAEEPVLLDDPVAQSNLIRAAMFGKAPG